jgi:phenylalanyl-tRNA synthetase beta chain
VVASRDLNAEVMRRYLVEHAGGPMGSDVIEDVSVFDVYQGKGIAPDKVSLAFGIQYRSADRTLKDGEVAEAFDAVLESLQKEFGVEIR